jgi:hypothetical protein
MKTMNILKNPPDGLKNEGGFWVLDHILKKNSSSTEVAMS